MAKPTIAELRPVIQPPEKMGRRSGEHWAGLLYMRRVSPHVTRQLVDAPVSPNTLTGLMTIAGVAAGPLLLVPTVAGPLLAALATQLYLLLDCVDGEVARWRKQFSVTGVYLDRIGAYLAEAALFVGAGFRASQLRPDGYAVLGCVAALGVVLIKSETDLVDGARLRSGLPAVTEAASVPRSARAAKARLVASALRFHRVVVGIEASLLLVVTGVIDQLHGGTTATRVLVAVFAVVALVQTVLHLASVLLSSRLR
jgi:phosphatidylserine synthase